MAHVLVELRVRDLGVIDDASLVLAPGTTALTGETGAGKTLLIGALSLLLGGRADPSVVRTGATEAVVEGRFCSIDGDDEIVLARAVAQQGRSRAWVDGRMVPVGALAEAAAGLIELHGQHQHRSLVHPEAQRQALDAFGAIDIGPLLSARRRVAELEAEADRLGGDARQRAREVEILSYQADEIDRAGITDPAEDEVLAEEEERLAEASSHREAAARALVSLEGAGGSGPPGGIDLVAEASGSLSGRGPLEALDARARGAIADLTDLAGELRSVVETWEDDPERLDAVRARRNLLHELTRKYGPTLADVMTFGVEARATLAELAGAEARAAVLDAEIDAARKVVESAEEVVARARRKVAPLLADEIQTTLHQLAMPSARFSIRVGGPGSADEVVFELAANAGESAQPLAKAASGGELSRTMLALRLALTDAPGVLVFDEVDAGVGGAAATAVGAALAGLGHYAQVLVVTHLAQVAAQADHQFEVRKVEADGRTRSLITALDDEDRVVELSRMLSGQPESDAARTHARELLALRPTDAR